MALETRLLQEKDKELFDHFMATSPKGHILQTWEWGDLKAFTGWTPLRLAVFEDEKIVGAMSILKRPLPILGYSLFYSSRGPVLDINRQDVWQALLAGAKEQAKLHKAAFLKIDPDVLSEDEKWQKAIQEAGFISAVKGEGFESVQPRYVYRLDISPDEDILLANCHQKTRYNIRLAEKKGVQIKKDCPKEDLPVFYEILTETAKRDQFLIRSYAYFEHFYDLLVPQGLASLFLATYEDQVIAGTLVFLLGDKCWYIYGASSNQHRNKMPNYLIQWQMIRWAKEHGATMYDFRGVPGDVPEDHHLYGLVKFKKGFNGDFTQFIGEYDLVYHPFFYRFYQLAEPFYQNKVKKIIKKIRGKK